MNRHLDTRLRARTLKHQIKPILLLKLLQRRRDILLRPSQLLLARLRLLCRREAVHLVREPLRAREVEPRLVDVDRDDARGAVGLCERACEEPDRAHAEDENGPGGGGREARAAGGVEEDGEGLGERRRVEAAVVWEAASTKC